MIKFADLTLNREKNLALFNDVEDILRSGQYVYGKRAARFEEAWGRYCGATFAIGTKSGSAALVAILKSLFRKGDGIIIPGMTFAATGMAVLLADLRPVVVDVDADGLLNQKQALKVAEEDPGVAGAIFVHLFGQAGIISGKLVERLIVVEDACQAHGIRQVQGHAAAFSFYPSKNLGAAGDAGAVVTNSLGVNAFVRRYISYGDNPGRKYQHNQVGDNLRMDEIQAAVLLNKLDRLDIYNEKRSNVASIYQSEGILSLARHATANYWHLYPVLVENPEWSREVMLRAGVETGNHYPYTMDEVMARCGFSGLSRPHNAAFIAKHVMTLPIGPHISTGEVFQVVREFYNFHEFKPRSGLWGAK